MYNQAQINQWIDEICSKVTKQLVEMNKPFKYLGDLIASRLVYDLICLLLVSSFSVVHDNAKERSWCSYGTFLFLGSNQ
jgi:hypothetical protein